MVHYLSVMMAVSDIFLLLDGSAEAKAKKADLWSYLKAHTSPAVFHSIRYGFGGVTNLNFPKGGYHRHRLLPHRAEALQIQLK